MGTPEEEAAEGARIGTKFQEWSMHGQVGEDVQDALKIGSSWSSPDKKKPLRIFSWESGRCLQGKRKNGIGWLPPLGAFGSHG